MSLGPLFLMAASVPTADTPPPPSPSVQCEAPGGHFRLMKLSGSARSIDARVRVLRRQPGILLVGEWSPAGGLAFLLSKKNEIAGIQVYVNSYEPEKLKIALRRPGTGGTIEFAEAPVGATVLISASLENGMLTVSADGIRQTAKVDDKDIKGTALMCSSGAFEFSLGDGLQIDPTNQQGSFDPWVKETK